MAEIVWSEEAERWLREIHDYIALEIRSLPQKSLWVSLKSLRCSAVFQRLAKSTAMSLRAKSEFCFMGIIV